MTLLRVLFFVAWTDDLAVEKKRANRAMPLRGVRPLDVLLVDPAAVFVSPPHSAPHQATRYRAPGKCDRPNVPAVKKRDMAVRGESLERPSVFHEQAKHGAGTLLMPNAIG